MTARPRAIRSTRLGDLAGMMLAGGIVLSATLTGCAAQPASGAGTQPEAPAAEATGTPAEELRLGYFANVTHAPALVGLEEGLIEDALGDTELSTQVFNAGPAAIEALSAGAIDATYIGPNPAINTFVASGGQSARIVAGAASGGAALVVQPGIESADDLAGTNLASPQLGNTQDVALRTWLGEEGYETSTSGGGDVTISPTENAQTLTLFQSGELDGAWLPEPWVSRLVVDAGAEVLVDEADLWEDGEFPTTVLLVRADFLAEHPETVRALVAGHVASVDWLAENPDAAADVINARLTADAGKGLSDAVIDRALEHVEFTFDPHADTFEQLLQDGVDAGTSKQGDIDGLFDLSALNAVLEDSGEESVSAASLGTE
ncbi:NitT/TauT family transport system substrate-binding protein [Agromyces flavus]|uniref:NitT/TauT family transport system substrate-binding protein n=1 Tax=Agromyces flavus TaxID=589382 RepID=A0A1H1Z8Q7_9MICO|nr:ABC transporter substrate-binding protein [Agromyces flavus]MCP2366974.1 NitT/TauT family transport system substrate-binding protein [Agromyces flavus]GGI46652.1 sulfonate ABC transporter substrate-binding protein [Agromyces flavus]SDT30098.1 NitT/TauT family transport system substrate-binding protein [Agromyces flavus]